MTGADVRRTAIPRTLSMGLALGRAIRAIRQARERKTDPFEAIADTLSTTPHHRRLRQGVARIASDDDLVIRFQNENLTAERGGRLLAIVPHLICLLELDSRYPASLTRSPSSR